MKRLVEAVAELGVRGHERPRRMRLILCERAWQDCLYWQKTDRRLVQRIDGLNKEVGRTPFEGTGKPGPLRHALPGCWPRRITDEHRIV